MSVLRVLSGGYPNTEDLYYEINEIKATHPAYGEAESRGKG